MKKILIKTTLLFAFLIITQIANSQTRKIDENWFSQRHGLAWAQNNNEIMYTNSMGGIEIKKFNGLFWTTLFTANGNFNGLTYSGASVFSSQYYNGDLYFIWFGYYLKLLNRTLSLENNGDYNRNMEALMKWDGTNLTVVDTFEFSGRPEQGILDMDTFNNKLIISGYSPLFNTGSTLVEYNGSTLKKCGNTAFTSVNWQLVNFKDSLMVVAQNGLYMYNGSSIKKASLLNNVQTDDLSHVYKHPDSSSYIIRLENWKSYYCESGKTPFLILDDSASYGANENFRFRQLLNPTYFGTRNGSIYTYAFTNDVIQNGNGSEVPLIIQKYTGNKVEKLKLPKSKYNQVVGGGPIYIPKVFGNEKIYFTCNQGVYELEGDTFFTSGSDTLYNASISGKVFLDKNGDNIFNGTDEVQTNKYVYTTNGYASITDNLGNYTIQNVAIGKDTLKYNPSFLHILHKPTTANRYLTLGKDSNILRNIVLRYDSARKDISIKIGSNKGVRHRRGFTETYSLFITNNSTEIKSGTVEIKLDPGYNAKSTTDPNFTSTTDGYQYTFTNIGPYQTSSANFDLTTALTLNLNDKVTITAKTDNATLTWDNQKLNNYDTTKYIIKSSYDPNDKSSDKDGNNMPGLSTINYHINFQNMGNDTAYTVVVADTIESNLQLETISNVTASHLFNLSLVGSKILLFTFNNILLVDSATNTPKSKGYIDFQIKAAPNLPHGTVIKNKASIYFDFNEPIITNFSVINIKDSTINIKQIIRKNNIQLYPNPAYSLVHIKAENAIKSVTIFDINGKQIHQQNENLNTINVSNLKAGLYLFNIKTANSNATFKVMVN